MLYIRLIGFDTEAEKKIWRTIIEFWNSQVSAFPPYKDRTKVLDIGSRSGPLIQRREGFSNHYITIECTDQKFLTGIKKIIEQVQTKLHIELNPEYYELHKV